MENKPKDKLIHQIPEEMLSPLSLAIEASKMGTWVWDIKSGMVDYSPRKMEIFGFPYARGTLQAFTEKVHPDDLGRIWAEIQECLAEKKAWASEFRYFKDGKVIWVLESGEIGYNSAGEPIKMTGITKDITPFKTKVFELSESQRNLTEAQALTHLGSWEIDLKTMEQTCSKELYNLFGFNDKEVFPNYEEVISRIHPDDRTGAINEAVNFISCNNSISHKYEFRLLIPTKGSNDELVNKIKYIETRCRVISDEKGVPSKIIGASLDVTDSREKEQKIQSQQSVISHTSKIAALGQMAGGIAHEINNPLAIIMNRLDLLQMKLEASELDNSLYEKDLESIQTTIFRIKKIVGGLKTFCQDEPKDESKVIELKEIVDNTLDLCSEKFKKRGIEIKVSDFSDLKIHGSGNQMSQVLLNLLNNSYDALENLPEKWILIDFKQKPHSKLEISVTDSGAGICAQNLDKVMQPFFTTKEIGKGVGLNLSISKGIVEGHNGTLSVDRTSANTRFVIEIPYLPLTLQLAS